MPHSCLVSQDGLTFVVPVCHYKAEFAALVASAFAEVQPDRVAVELPSFLGPIFLNAVARFPRLSILSYEAPSGTMILPVEPTDPFAEAARTAFDQARPIHFVDLHVEGYEPSQDWLPDSYSLTAIGFERWWAEWVKVNRRARSADDQARESHMVQNLRGFRQLYPKAKILLVCGAMHALNILDGLNQDIWDGRLLAEAPAPKEVAIFQPDVDSVRQISCEIPLMMALYELNRGGEGPPETWQAPPQEEPPAKDDTPLAELSKDEVFDSLSALLGLKKKVKAPTLKTSNLRKVADYLNRLQEKPMLLTDLLSQVAMSSSGEQIQLPKAPPPQRVAAFTFKQMNDRRDGLLAIYRELSERANPKELDRQKVLVGAVDNAADFYKENTGESIVRWQKETLFQYMRNYASLKSRLLPGTFEMVMGARGVADDNFSYEVWDLLSFYPWTEDDPNVPKMRLDAEELFLGDRQVKRWTFHRTLPRMRKTAQRVPIKKRAEEGEGNDPGNWSDEFRGASLCSYPPEDIIIEDYGRFLQKKAVSMLSLEKTRVEPFSTSILDGIDMRETMRNWNNGTDASGKTIYVREAQRITGGVGAVVVIFDRDDAQNRYPWKMTWHGEHKQESDMSFYATPITNKIVGPGIARCEYGGLMLSYPNRRLADVWSDDYYAGCQNKAEVLLMAALDYSLEKHVIYVAAQPPRSQFKTLAGRLGRKVVYIPIGQLSPQSLKKIRVFHVLSGHQRRKIARDFIW